MAATWNEWWARFNEALAALPDDVRQDTIAALREAFDPVPGPEPNERSVKRNLNGQWDPDDLYYAVQDADFDLLRDLVKPVWSAFSTQGWSALIDVPSLMALMFRIRRRRIPLNVEQGLVLLALKQRSNGMTADEVAALLADDGIPRPARAEDILQSLTAATRPDGIEVGLVQFDGKRWRPLNV